MKIIFSNMPIQINKIEVPTTSIINVEDRTNVIIKKKYIQDIDKTFVRPFAAQALGDAIAWSSFILRLREINNGKLKINRLKSKDKMVICDIFNKSIDGFEVSNKEEFKFNRMECYNYKFLPCSLQWEPNNSNIVCYQFDTNHSEDKQIKTQNEKDMILEHIKSKGLIPFKLSSDVPINQCIEALSTCKFFIGICSGMSHLAHVVGTPVHMICNGRSIERVKLHHGNNARGPVYFHQLPSNFVTTWS